MQRHLVDTPAGSVHVRSTAAGDTTVALFHQSPSSSRMWAGVMELLADSGVTCAAPDMLDYGHSDRQDHQLTLEEHAALLLDAVQSVVGDVHLLVGHHTGAVFAASAATRGAAVRGVAVIGYPLYTSWREKLERLGDRVSPDRFDTAGEAAAELWVKLNASIEDTAGHEVRHGIYVDRLLASPLWYTAYAALMAADLEAPLRALAGSGVVLETVFARDDAISRLEPGVTALTGVEPRWIDGGPWVTVEHPDRVAARILDFVERVA